MFALATGTAAAQPEHCVAPVAPQVPENVDESGNLTVTADEAEIADDIPADQAPAVLEGVVLWVGEWYAAWRDPVRRQARPRAPLDAARPRLHDPSTSQARHLLSVRTPIDKS